nr:uncharacterized protein LOC104210114 [Ipomoea trifida]GMD03503.1 uncharacterized protein LOC104210114 [Ipomoea batatas]GMD05731.1 uncharacterized protein LOC104210114 [Ipomoea batatas]GMD07313.1 uncharacterized protein LOC104210114 [Ipomoea batatas]GMD09321.1 uncharacterized protein LOC104210114 [Ipomoea batatas]
MAGKKSSFSIMGMFKSKPKANLRSRKGDDYYRDDFAVKAYKVFPSDEDRRNWVAEPGIDSKATAFINGRTALWSNYDVTN